MSIAQIPFEQDTIQINTGPLVFTFIGHGSLMFTFNKMVIQVDPVSRYADYNTLPKADLILVTHHHGDHLDPGAIKQLTQAGTDIIFSESCAQQLEKGIVMKNGDVKKIKGLTIEAVPAYNLVHKRDNGEPFHPKGVGNGYIITCGEKKIYIAGDTENIPEMLKLTGIDIAFLPMNLPYTMTPEMVASAVKAFKPKILYPYHYGDTDVNQLLKLLKDFPETEVRVRQMQ
jgi:L-ascorbate metabolism protein UlaG (beta-lactamase superfamily)